MWKSKSCAALLFLSISFVFGQSDNGSISGFAKDPSGASVPKAKVTLRNEGTGEEHVISTNDTGYYTVTNIPPSFYSVSVEAAGLRSSPVRITSSIRTRRFRSTRCWRSDRRQKLSRLRRARRCCINRPDGPRLPAAEVHKVRRRPCATSADGGCDVGDRDLWMRCCAGDGGMALRDRPAGGGLKPPQAAAVKSRGGERCGKGARDASGAGREGERE